jgi:hypothetical protein
MNRVIALVLRVTVFFIVTMVFLAGTGLLVRHYRNRWYKQQQNYITKPVCEKIQPGMSSNEVWTLVEKAGEPQIVWQAPTMLGFATINGEQCTVWLNPTSNNVVRREYQQPTQHFVLIQ